MMRMVKKNRKAIHGVLLLNKPRGISSTQALGRAKWLIGADKAGHTGTLDPLADGLLPLCFGHATKLANDLLDADKTYVAGIVLGKSTTTGDREGEITFSSDTVIAREQWDAILPQFSGEIAQVPPMYSALKKDGKPLYELARAGIEVEREARQVTIVSLETLSFAYPNVVLKVRCSKGTYIRTLAEDLGRALACGAHLTALRRVAVGSLSIERAVTLDTLDHLREDERSRWLLPPDSLLQSLPEVILDRQDAQRFSHGNPVVTVPSASGKCRVYCEGRLLGVGTADGSGTLQPSRLVASN